MMTFKEYAKPLMSRLNNKVNIKKCVKNSTKTAEQRYDQAI